MPPSLVSYAYGERGRAGQICLSSADEIWGGEGRWYRIFHLALNLLLHYLAKFGCLHGVVHATMDAPMARPVVQCSQFVTFPKVILKIKVAYMARSVYTELRSTVGLVEQT